MIQRESKVRRPSEFSTKTQGTQSGFSSDPIPLKASEVGSEVLSLPAAKEAFRNRVAEAARQSNTGQYVCFEIAEGFYLAAVNAVERLPAK